MSHCCCCSGDHGHADPEGDSDRVVGCGACRTGGPAAPAEGSAWRRAAGGDRASGSGRSEQSGDHGRAAEFRRFLDTVEAKVPRDLDIHVVMDNASSHKTKLIRGWFARRPHWHAHYTPTSASWINQVERFFAPLTDDQIRRSAHRPTADSRQPSPPTSTPTTPSPSPSDGPRPLTTCLPPSSASVSAPSGSKTTARKLRSQDSSTVHAGLVTGA
jgi:transposase